MRGGLPGGLTGTRLPGLTATAWRHLQPNDVAVLIRSLLAICFDPARYVFIAGGATAC